MKTPRAASSGARLPCPNGSSSASSAPSSTLDVLELDLGVDARSRRRTARPAARRGARGSRCRNASSVLGGQRAADGGRVTAEARRAGSAHASTARETGRRPDASGREPRATPSSIANRSAGTPYAARQPRGDDALDALVPALARQARARARRWNCAPPARARPRQVAPRPAWRSRLCSSSARASSSASRGSSVMSRSSASCGSAMRPAALSRGASAKATPSGDERVGVDAPPTAASAAMPARGVARACARRRRPRARGSRRAAARCRRPCRASRGRSARATRRAGRAARRPPARA